MAKQHDDARIVELEIENQQLREDLARMRDEMRQLRSAGAPARLPAFAIPVRVERNIPRASGTCAYVKTRIPAPLCFHLDTLVQWLKASGTAPDLRSPSQAMVWLLGQLRFLEEEGASDPQHARPDRIGDDRPGARVRRRCRAVVAAIRSVRPTTPARPYCAVLGSGASLRLLPGDIDTRATVIAGNRAIQWCNDHAVRCDWWCWRDRCAWPQWGSLPWGGLCVPRQRMQEIGRPAISGRPVILQDGWRPAFCWSNKTMLHSLLCAYLLGHDLVHVWGCDWDGVFDWDGVDSGGRSQERWRHERHAMEFLVHATGMVILRHYIRHGSPCIEWIGPSRDNLRVTVTQ